jgi:hypothetical protein
MLRDDCVDVLDRLLEATEDGRLAWRSDPEDDFVAALGPEGDEVVIRRLWMEVVGRPGADPYQIELTMPGWAVRFPIAGDSEGCRRVCAILEAAGFPLACGGSARDAVAYLDIHLPRRRERPAEPGAAPDPAGM